MLTRREVLASGVAAAAAAALPLSSFAAAEPAKRTLRLAVMWYMVGEGKTVLEKFQILKDCGFDGVEMDSPSDIKPEEVLEAQAKTGIKVHGLVDSVHWKFHLNAPDEKVRDQGRAGLETALRDAKRFGSTSVLLVPGVVNAKQPYDDAWTLSMEQIRKALPVAKECGIKIAVENVWNNFLLSPLEAARYVDDFKDPSVVWHFDIGNVINTGFPAQWIKVLGKRIAKLHIKDFSRKKRDDQGLWKGFDVELGQGDADWPAVIKALDEIGYSTAPEGNWATAEVGGGDAEHLTKIREIMQSLLISPTT